MADRQPLNPPPQQFDDPPAPLPAVESDQPPSPASLPAEEAAESTKKDTSKHVTLVLPPETEIGSKQELVEIEKTKSTGERKIPESLISFKEESNLVADLSDSERKALQELNQLVQDGLNNHSFTSPAPPKAESDSTSEVKGEESLEKQSEEVAKKEEDDEVFIWGIPLLKDDRSDVILLKFLRARDFKVKDAFTMLKNTIKWRKEFGIDALVNEDLGDDLERMVFMHGYDREGHPVCYNVYGEFQNKDLYKKTFTDAEKRTKFIRWRIQFLERSIRKLDFSPGGVCSLFQVNDLKNLPGPGKSELRLATKQALQLLQDNYPEFVAKQVFINAPWWYLAFYGIISPFLTQRTKSKFVFVGPSKTAETLFKYISPEHVPVQYGGLSVDYCHCNPEFTIDDPAIEVTLKPATKQTIEIIIYEKCIIVWELRVVGWEVSHAAEFVPNAEGAYAVIIQKPTKMTPTDEPVVTNSFRVSELGKLHLIIDNPTSRKKTLLYRFIIKPLSD